MADPSFWLLFALAFMALLAWAGRLWIRNTVESSVRSNFEAQLEAVRSELRLNEAKLNALQQDVLGRRAGRQALLDQRRFKAIENIWAATLRANKFRAAVSALTFLKLDKVGKAVRTDPHLREMVNIMKGGDLRDQLNTIGGEEERPFLPDDVWALFTAYTSVMIFCFLRLDMISTGIENSEKLFSDEKVVELVRGVLPEQSAYLEEYGIVGVAHSVVPMREKLLVALQNTLRGAAADEESVQQAASILRLVEGLNLSRAITKTQGTE